jgi:class 3 adenylate cyclase/tetratricopeptide (TPR) repeat protein
VLVRKTVTVLFCDVTESTRLGESLDPETHRRVMSRYFEEMSAAIEAHGGTVEKFIGDAVMAVFGVPTVHEDDALRAVRAAADMRKRLAVLNEELESVHGVALQTRTGVNTGEVVAGDPTGRTLVTGDAVVVAKRLEEAAPPGEILIGKATYPLVQHAINAGPLQTFSAKGKTELPSRRIDEVRTGEAAIARRFDVRLVGRSAELERLRSEFGQAVSGQTARLVTVLGPAGIGKSRLARELLAEVDGKATVLVGRCLPYGEGITFWPIVELVRAAGGEEAVRASLADTEQGDVIAERVLAAVSPGDDAASTEEMFWGIRRYLETLAATKPLVVCLEDVQWAEVTFLDLVDYLAGWAQRAPILFLCLARPDLLERRPGWSAPRDNAVIVSLEALHESASNELLAELLEDEAIRPAIRERIAEAAEGNPLFLEQLTAMAAESGNGGALSVPPSIQAVISARLDGLDSDERAVVECAAIVGKEFVRGAIVELAAPETRGAVGGALRELVRKGVVVPHAAGASAEDGFRFGHVLIRDVAYEAMPKQLRAELHERFPDWIAAHVGGGELDEIIAYHLEQAYRYRTELGPADERARDLAARASTLLGRAGRRAFGRGDMPAAVALLSRAHSLHLQDDEQRLELGLVFGEALIESGDFERAEATLLDVARAADARHAPRVAALAAVELAYLHLYTDLDAGQAARAAEEALRVFEGLEDAYGAAKARMLLARTYFQRCWYGQEEEALQQALTDARDEGDRRLLVAIRGGLARAAVLGPRPVGEAREICRGILTDAAGDPSLEAVIHVLLATLSAMEGQFDDARALYRSAQAVFDELGLRLFLAGMRSYSGIVELIAGNPAGAEAEFASGYAELERIGERGRLSTLAALRAYALALEGRHDEADTFVRKSLDAAARDDVSSQVFARLARSISLGARGRLEEAETVAREAAALVEDTDDSLLRPGTAAVLAEILLAQGDEVGAAAEAERALSLYTAKGNVVSSERVRVLDLGTGKR